MKTLLLALAVCALAAAPAHAAPKDDIWLEPEPQRLCDPYDPNDIADPNCVDWL